MMSWLMVVISVGLAALGVLIALHARSGAKDAYLAGSCFLLAGVLGLASGHWLALDLLVLALLVLAGLAWRAKRAWGRPLGAVAGGLGLVLALAHLGLQLTGGGAPAKLAEREERYAAALADHFATLAELEYGGQYALVLYPRHDAWAAQVAKLVVLRLRRGQEVPVGTLAPPAGADPADEQLAPEWRFDAAEWQELLRQWEPRLVISLAGLPAPEPVDAKAQLAASKSASSGTSGPALLLYGVSQRVTRERLLNGEIRAVVVQQPGYRQQRDPGPPKDPAQAFAARYLHLDAQTLPDLLAAGTLHLPND